MCIRVEVYLMLSKNKQVAGAIHTGSRAPHAHSHTCMQQVLLVAPPRLHALRQQAAAMLLDDAQCWMGRACLNADERKQWYQLAAPQGHVGAANLLAKM